MQGQRALRKMTKERDAECEDPDKVYMQEMQEAEDQQDKKQKKTRAVVSPVVRVRVQIPKKN